MALPTLSFECGNHTPDLILSGANASEPYTTKKIRCCFSTVPDAECDIMKDGRINQSCMYPFEHPRDSWFLRLLDEPTPSVQVFRDGRVVLFSRELAETYHVLYRCSETVASQSLVSRHVSVDGAVAGSFFGGVLCVLLIACVYRWFRQAAVRGRVFMRLKPEQRGDVL